MSLSKPEKTVLCDTTSKLWKQEIVAYLKIAEAQKQVNEAQDMLRQVTQQEMNMLGRQ
jgi:hypothetical protein